MKKFILPVGVLLVVAGVVAVGVILSKDVNPDVQVPGQDIQASDHAKGNPQSAVQLIEYGDMQCPACATFDPLVERLLSENPDLVHFAFRHLPLNSIHKNADAGAWAVEAAASQGKFWEMKALMYSRQAEWAGLIDPATKFNDYALGLGLEEARFISDYNSDTVKGKVAAHLAAAKAAGFNSTPTFVVNGRKIANPTSYEQFVELLRSSAQ